MNVIEIEVLDSIQGVAAHEWDALVDGNDPFLEHGFLAALEISRSIGAHAGCVPRLVLARDRGQLVGAVPLYLKTHSYGEYIFDWAWADAAYRANIPYYPKLVAAVPYTPATGQRLPVLPGYDAEVVRSTLLRGVRAIADAERASSIHFLFCTAAEARALARDTTTPHAERLSMQFHWNNRAEKPFVDFEDFLSKFKSRHRKQVHKERALAASYDFTYKTALGCELSTAEWQSLQRFYASNVTRHGGIEYLQPAFFEIARKTLGHRLVTTLAHKDNQAIAGTISFEKGNHLFGRYWGYDEQFETLHFELCYYRLLERAIERRHTHFEAGAQGEHKLKRGLLPAYTHSAHWIRHPALQVAIRRFLVAECAAIAEQMAQLAALSPFRTDDATSDDTGTTPQSALNGKSTTVAS